MTSKLKVFVTSMLMAASSVIAEDSFFSGLSQDELYQKIDSYDLSSNGSKARDAAEVFVARFPQDRRINEVKVKLLAAYIASNKFPLAKEYAKRLLASPVFDSQYIEDVEYYQIMILIEQSKHWLTGFIKINDRFRNIHDLESSIGDINAFLAKYPNSKYEGELRDYYDEIRVLEASHQLEVAKHYAQKGNFDAASKRLDRYFDQYSDVETPLLDELLKYPELG